MGFHPTTAAGITTLMVEWSFMTNYMKLRRMIKGQRRVQVHRPVGACRADSCESQQERKMRGHPFPAIDNGTCVSGRVYVSFETSLTPLKLEGCVARLQRN
jgi:hypothetical protein